MSKHDPHNREKNLESTINNLRDSSYTESEVEKLLEFKDFLYSQNISTERVERYLCTFKVLESEIDFSLTDPSREEIVQLVGDINQGFEDLSVWTKAEYRKCVKRFFEYVDNELDLSFIRTGAKKSNQPRTDPSKLPQPEDVKSIKKHMEKSRNKAFVSVLWQTGGRVSEVLNLKWKDVSEEEKFTWVRFRESKTGERKVPMEDLEDLEEWRSDHPDSSEEEYIFTRLKDSTPITYNGIIKHLKKAGRSSGVDCDYCPHDFRKGRATFLATRGMNQATMCEFFGWTQGSDQVDKYVRMADADLKSAFSDLQERSGRRKVSRVPVQH